MLGLEVLRTSLHRLLRQPELIRVRPLAKRLSKTLSHSQLGDPRIADPAWVDVNGPRAFSSNLGLCSCNNTNLCRMDQLFHLCVVDN